MPEEKKDFIFDPFNVMDNDLTPESKPLLQPDGEGGDKGNDSDKAEKDDVPGKEEESVKDSKEEDDGLKDEDGDDGDKEEDEPKTEGEDEEKEEAQNDSRDDDDDSHDDDDDLGVKDISKEREKQETNKEDDADGVDDIGNLSDEDLDRLVDKLVKSSQDANDDEVSKDSDAYKELESSLRDAEENVSSLNTELESVRMALEKRTQKLRELGADAEEVKLDYEIAKPYIETIKSDPNLKDAIMNIAKIERTDDADKKSAFEEKAVSALYSYLEGKTGVDIRKMIDNQSKKGKSAVSKEEGSEAASSVDSKSPTNEADVGLAMSLLG